jgi:hypothetical protein
MGTVLQRRESDQAIRKVHAAVATAVGETLRSLLGKDVKVEAGDIVLGDAAEHRAGFTGQTVVVRCDLQKDYAGKTLRIAFEAAEASSDLGQALCSAVEGALVAVLGETIGLAPREQAVVKGGQDKDGVLGTDPLVALCFTLMVAAGPPASASASVLVDPASAEAWNGEALEWVEAGGKDAQAVLGEPGSGTCAPAKNLGVEELEAIPLAPIRGKLSAFLIDNDSLFAVRKSCRRVGFELDRRARTDIPNPAAHKDHVVVIEVPANEERRFDWSKRLKAYNESIRVVLLLHHPTRQRVLLGFMAKADALIGVPVQEELLSKKLESLLDVMLKAKDQQAPVPASDAPAKPA